VIPHSPFAPWINRTTAPGRIWVFGFPFAAKPEATGFKPSPVMGMDWPFSSTATTLLALASMTAKVCDRLDSFK